MLQTTNHLYAKLVAVPLLPQLGLPIIETTLTDSRVLTILLDAESTLLPLVIDLTELFDCHVCHIRDKLKYRAKVRTKTQADKTGFTDSLHHSHDGGQMVQLVLNI